MSKSTSWSCLSLAAGIYAAALLSTSVATDSLLVNGSFRDWKKGAPDGWKVSIGAQRGKGPSSIVRRAAPDGIVLEGNRQTREWLFVSQQVDCRAGETLRLDYRAHATGLKREPGQRDNCYVGILFRGSNGKTVSVHVQNVRNEKTAPAILIARVPKSATSCDVAVFLSKTGKLVAGQLRLTKPTAADSFQLLVEHMDRYYSYFALRKTDWKRLAAGYRDRAERAKSPERFAEVSKELLAKLKDIHVWMELPGGTRIFPRVSRVEGNYNFRAIGGRLKNLQQIGRIAFAGRTQEGFGYVAIGSLAGPEAPFLQIEKAIDAMLDANGFIIDLRANSGGSEPRAQRIAAIFTDKVRRYAQSQIRSGPKHTDLTTPRSRSIAPRQGKTFTRPVVCLIGPRCVSSGEGFALMLKALPHVRLVGQTTRGASGNPQPVLLPNGVTVYYSRWVAMQADGKVFESTGIAPEIRVKHTSEGDVTFDRAVEELKKEIKRHKSR